jgi:hypothetical protein
LPLDIKISHARWAAGGMVGLFRYLSLLRPRFAKLAAAASARRETGMALSSLAWPRRVSGSRQCALANRAGGVAAAPGGGGSGGCWRQWQK